MAADKTSPLGSWRIAAEDETAISILEGLKKYTGNTITYSQGADVTLGKTQFVWETKINTTDKSGFAEAIINAKNADVVLLMLGEHGLQSGEGRSRSEIGLPGVQQELLEEIYKVNSNVVLVLTNGRPLTIPWAAENIPSILETWHLGTQSGNAIAEVLYGDYNPSGKLPMSFPRTVGQVPIYYNHKNTGRPASNEPESVFWSHYGDVYNTPQFAFGHGLSYSKFTYSDITLDNTSFAKNGKITATINVTNDSKIEGKEVVQLYIKDLIGSLTRPVLELKGFEMIILKPNETKTVSFIINEKTIEYFTANKKWEAESGNFKLFIGGSSDVTKQTNFSFSN